MLYKVFSVFCGADSCAFLREFAAFCAGVLCVCVCVPPPSPMLFCCLQVLYLRVFLRANLGKQRKRLEKYHAVVGISGKY